VRSIAVLTIATVVSACTGQGNHIPAVAPASLQSQRDVRTSQSGGIFRVEVTRSHRFSGMESVRDRGQALKGIRVIGKRGAYWFAEDATLASFHDYLIVRGYGKTFVFRKSDVHAIDNRSEIERNVDSREHDTPVASSLLSGRVHQAPPTSACGDCIVISPPKSDQSTSRSHKSLILRPVCDSSIDGSCDYCGPAAFFAWGCCDLAVTPDCITIGPGGYYDSNFNWVTDACADFLDDPLAYAACAFANGGGLFAIVPRIHKFRGPGVQFYNWYFDGYTFLQVTSPNLSGLVPYTYDWYMNDLFNGRSTLVDVPIYPAAAVLNVWCFFHSNTSAFTSTTLVIKDPAGREVGTWSASDADIAGVTSPTKCPL
jgi:hypothetical protein